jgi:hypothetical protein
MTTLGVAIASVGFRFEVDDPELAHRLADRYRGFEGSQGTPVRLASMGTARPFTANIPGTVRREGSTLRASAAEEWGALDRARREGWLVPHPSMALLDMLVRAEITLAALDAGGLALHASAVELNGAAHLFAGVSGAGKSTVARQLEREGGRILSDEVVILRPSPQGWLAYGTPFWVGSPAASPLRRVWALAFGSTRVDPLTPPAALRHLSGALSLIVQGDAEVEASLDAAARLVGEIPAATLRFPLGEPIRKTVEGA